MSFCLATALLLPKLGCLGEARQGCGRGPPGPRNPCNRPMASVWGRLGAWSAPAPGLHRQGVSPPSQSASGSSSSSCKTHNLIHTDCCCRFHMHRHQAITPGRGQGALTSCEPPHQYPHYPPPRTKTATGSLSPGGNMTWHSRSSHLHLHPPLAPSSSSSHLHPWLAPSSSSRSHQHLHPPLAPSSSSSHLHLHPPLAPGSSSSHLHLHPRLAPSSSSSHLHLHPPLAPSSSSSHLHLHPPLAPSCSSSHLHLHPPLAPSSSSSSHLHLHPTLTPSSSSSSSSHPRLQPPLAPRRPAGGTTSRPPPINQPLTRTVAPCS